MQTVTDDNGIIVKRYAFDPWGRRRNPDTWKNLTYDEIMTEDFIFDRGYTGHEHLDEFGLINMNGRMYDPYVGRFLSPDPIVQTDNSQNFNRYSYAINNPLKYTDPTGYSKQAFLDEIHRQMRTGIYINYDAVNSFYRMLYWDHGPGAPIPGWYTHAGDGVYLNSNGEEVSFNEVFLSCF